MRPTGSRGNGFKGALEQEVKTCTNGHERTSSLPDVSFFHGKETTESLQFVNQDIREEGLERWPRGKVPDAQVREPEFKFQVPMGKWGIM